MTKVTLKILVCILFFWVESFSQPIKKTFTIDNKIIFYHSYNEHKELLSDWEIMFKTIITELKKDNEIDSMTRSNSNQFRIEVDVGEDKHIRLIRIIFNSVIHKLDADINLIEKDGFVVYTDPKKVLILTPIKKWISKVKHTKQKKIQ